MEGKVRRRANKLLEDLLYRSGESGYHLMGGPYKKFMELCDLAEHLSDEFDGEGISVLVSPEDGAEGILQVDLPEMTLDTKQSHSFFDGIRNADYIGFSKQGENGIRVSLMVNGLWRVADAR